MTPRFSLAHLTVLGCDPAEATYIAADCGYDFVSFRTIALGLPGERRYPLAQDKAMLRSTRAALAQTGLPLLDIEVARIADDTEVEDYLPALENAAELGAKHVIACAYSKDRSRVVDSFSRLCQLADPLGLTVDFEFITFSDFPDLQQVYSLVKESGCRNAGILVDTLHFDRSHVALSELDEIPTHLFHFAQLCDAPKITAPTREQLIQTAREERLFLGEGDIPIRKILAHMPQIPCSIEIAHRKRQQDLGYKEFARLCLERARSYFERNEPSLA